ncbi:MAG: hypothetical protein ACI4EX_04875 [Lachnospiraceae bacterium]
MKESDNRKAPDFLSHETDGSQGIDSWTSNGYGIVSSQNTPEQQKVIDQINAELSAKESSETK